MNLHPANASSRTSSTPASDSLRPRARRLISGLSDDEDARPLDITSAPSTRIASPRGSRPTSPLPSKYPSRTSVRDSPPRSRFHRDAGLNKGGRTASPGFASIWGGSWSGLQGFASSLLGTETAGSSRGPSRSRTIESSPSRPRSGAPSQWGPSSSDHIQVGAGTREERDALVRAAKRKEMLRANGNGMVDASGRHKRRTSDDFTSLSVQPSQEDDRDALVYLHRVQPKDTFIGLTIKYNCQAQTIRKANRLWPNDPIQSRKTIMLPVDACGVKGRPVPGPEPIIEEQDLLSDPTETLSMHESPKEAPLDMINGWHKSTDAADTSETQPSSSLPASSTVSVTGEQAEQEWKHDSWVLFPNEKEPTEIARLPRRHLGYFPRARRKSNPYSDFGSPRSTPRPSFDLPRIPPSPGSAQSEAFAALRPSTSRQRSHSNSTLSQSTLFNGPGGIGTLGRNVRTIGPGKDRLNELLGPHLPNVAPPTTQQVFTPWNPGLGLRDEDLVSFAEAASRDGSATPFSDSPNGQGVDFQEMTGKVERWVRKTVKRAGSAYTASASVAAQKGAGVQGMGVGSGIGDLIELTDAFEIGEGEGGDVDDLIDVGGQAGGSSAAKFGGEGMRGRKLGRGGGEGGAKSGKDD